MHLHCWEKLASCLLPTLLEFEWNSCQSFKATTDGRAAGGGLFANVLAVSGIQYTASVKEQLLVKRLRLDQ